MGISEIRQFYAEEVRAVANIQSPVLMEAFATVARERFLGPGPWQIPCPNPDNLTSATYRTTEDADPRHVYHDVLVAIDAARELNNGHPSSLAFWIDMLSLREGDHVFHLGCGVGYYTAIMAQVVGPSGRVFAVEIDPELASRACANLAHLRHVHVMAADGIGYEPGECDAMFINAGVTHPQRAWLDQLRPQGRLIFPLTATGDDNQQSGGGMLKVVRQAGGYTARFISGVGIFPCMNGRNTTLNERLRKSFAAGPQVWQKVRSLHLEPHATGDTCWLHTDEFCLSMAPNASE
jgi:protein-L-isoaspartate(D-aspartate) O-methyltransferase